MNPTMLTDVAALERAIESGAVSVPESGAFRWLKPAFTLDAKQRKWSQYLTHDLQRIEDLLDDILHDEAKAEQAGVDVPAFYESMGYDYDAVHRLIENLMGQGKRKGKKGKKGKKGR